MEHDPDKYHSCPEFLQFDIMSSSDSISDTEQSETDSDSEWETEEETNKSSDLDSDLDSDDDENQNLSKTLDSVGKKLKVTPSPAKESQQDSSDEKPPVRSEMLENEDHNHSEKMAARKNSHSDQTSDDEGQTSPVSQSPTASRRTFSLQLQNASLEIQTFFKKLEKFWTRSHNLRRGTAPISMTTFNKVKERISCYLEFLRRQNLKVSPSHFEDERLVESYLDYLRNERLLHPATMANHVSSFLYAIKYLHRQSGPRYDEVSIVGRVRAMSTLLQKEGSLLRPNSHEQLETWANWEDIVKALAKQKRRVDEGVTVKERSAQMMNLVILSLYVEIPPGRAKEIRTAQIFEERREAEFQRFDEKKRKNFVVLKRNGDVMLHFDEYKTRRTYGADATLFEANLEIARNIRRFIRNHRKPLLLGGEHNFLLVNAHGLPFSASSFTQTVQRLFKDLLGVPIGIRELRSSFITHAFGQNMCNDSIKESIAAAMRHSKREAERTYDRRTGMERKRLALSFAQKQVSEIADSDEDSTMVTSAKPALSLKIGEFVALACSDSTLQKPKILLGRITHQSDESVNLLWYENLKDRKSQNLYRLCLDGKEWKEQPESLTRVNVVSSTREGDTVILLTEPTEIHRSSFGN